MSLLAIPKNAQMALKEPLLTFDGVKFWLGTEGTSTARSSLICQLPSQSFVTAVSGSLTILNTHASIAHRERRSLVAVDRPSCSRPVQTYDEEIRAKRSTKRSSAIHSRFCWPPILVTDKASKPSTLGPLFPARNTRIPSRSLFLLRPCSVSLTLYLSRLFQPKSTIL